MRVITADGLMTLLQALFSIGVMSCVQNALSGRRSRRIRLFPMIIIALVLMLAEVIGLSGRLAAAAALFGGFAADMGARPVLVINILLMAGFIAAKCVLRPVVSSVCGRRGLQEAFANGIYEYDDHYREWFLMRRWADYRRYVFALCCGVDAAAALLIFLCGTMDGSGAAIVYPCAAVVVFNEFYAYINGETKEEFTHSVYGDDSDSRRISNYYKLREIFHKLLPDPILYSHTGCEFTSHETAADYIKSLKESDVFEDRITAEYYEANDRYKTADADMVRATSNLMHRKNQIIFNPFYRDLGMYITLPMVRTLLSGKKCLVLCTRKEDEEGIREWIAALVRDYSHMRSLWRVGFLTQKDPEFEIGILTFTNIYNRTVLANNEEFLREVDFALLLEPSLMLDTSQVALSILARELSPYGEKPVYCIFDRYVDGLVDTLSHLLLSEITSVAAMPVPRCNYTAVMWDADADFRREELFSKETRFLGNGIEVAAIAVKNQVPDVTWYGGTRVPVLDLRWIAGQQYYPICRYMNQPCQQKSIDEKIRFVPSLWGSAKTKEQFLLVEDEFCNMFGMLRTFLSRGEKQIFVNVFSENYLLRDYMRCNPQVFLSNPNSVPSFMPDYARTERNIILKLIIMMSLRPVTEREIIQEFRLSGITVDEKNVLNRLQDLVKKYTFAGDDLFSVRNVRPEGDSDFESTRYRVSEEMFARYFSGSLKNAYYILENEEDEESYIDARLFGHVTQTILPGQFVTYGGKYYQAKFVSPQSGVILRRAADLYDGRKYYRQVREYHFEAAGSTGAVSNRKVMDIEFAELSMDFRVETTGYLELNDNHDLRTARKVDLSEDPSVSGFTRRYRNKSVLRIKLPESDDRVLFTLCLLLSEAFHSVFPKGWPYLAVLTRRPSDIGGMLNYLVYRADGDLLEEGYIYIVEDSDLDLGLLDTIEKNFMRLMELVEDYLEWHYEKMREPAAKDPVPPKKAAAQAVETKRRSLMTRLLDRIRKLFGGKEEKVTLDPGKEPAGAEPGETKAEGQEPTSAETAGAEPAGANADGAETTGAEPGETKADGQEPGETKADGENPDGAEPGDAKDDGQEPTGAEPAGTTDQEREDFPEDSFEPSGSDDPDLAHIDGTDIFDNEGMPEDNEYLETQFRQMGIVPVEKSRYQQECYLKFGFEEIDSRLHLEELKKYLRVRGFGNRSLARARKRDAVARTQVDTEVVNHCDFCGLPLTGISYDRLNDGRVRCIDCSRSAITSEADFRSLFYSCLEMMCDFYEISFEVPVTITMADAKVVARGSGMVFRPTKGVTPRVLGYAQKSRGRYSLIVENGSPRLAMIETMVHEMTHIWQFLNWNDQAVRSIYDCGDPDLTAMAREIVYEGMAVWASLQYMYQIGETYFASQREADYASRKDVYGAGFLVYSEQYPLLRESSLISFSPFRNFPPVEPDKVREALLSILK